ncbi:MAG: tetratricopeptide repeat protein [Leptonema sp. (in: bacteria)]
MMKYRILLIVILGILFACKTVKISEVKDWSQEEQQLKKAQEWIQLASIEYQKKNYPKAIELAQKSLNEFVTFDGYYIIGSSYYQLNLFDKGLENLLKAEKIKPNYEQLLLTLGLLYHSQQNYDLAISKFNRLLEIRPKDPVYAYRLGLAYKEKKEYSKAIEFLEMANQNQFTYRENVLLNLGDIYFELKDYEKSKFYYEELEKIKPNQEDIKESKSQLEIAVYLEKGNHAFKNKQYQLAEEAYQKIVQLKPKEKVGYLQLGILFLEIKDFSRAIENFLTALKIKKDKETYSYLCRAYLEVNDFTNFESCIKNSLVLYPDNENLLNLEALYYKKIGNYKRSISLLNQVLAKNSNSLPTRKNLYLIYLERGDFFSAKQQLDKIKEIDKTNLDFWKEEEQKLEAFEYLQKGNHLMRNRQYMAAKQEFLKALNLYKHPSIYIAMGDVNIKIGNLKEAETHYQRAKNSEIVSIFAYEKLLDFYKNYKRNFEYNQLKNEITQKSTQNIQMGLLYVNLLIKNKEYKEALKFLSDLDKKYKNNLAIQRNIAFVYYLQSVEANHNQNFDLAMQLLKKAISYHPENELYKSSLETLKDNIENKSLLPELEKAEKLYLSGKYIEAKKEFQNLYSKWKKPLILVRLAEIEFYMGNPYEGRKILESALKDKPKDVTLLEALYTRLIELNQLDEAEKGFKEILSMNEEAYYSYYKLGIIELLRRNYKESISYFDDSILFAPDFLPAKIAKGIAYYYLKDINMAKSIFEETAKQKGFGQELSMLNLALVYLNQDKNSEARKEIKKLIQLFPEYADAYYHLAYIEYEDKNFLEAEKLLLKAIELQKRDDYYYALITLYKPIDSKKSELKKVVREFLQAFPKSTYYDKVKAIFLELKDTKEFLEASYENPFPNYNVLFFDNHALFYNNQELISIQKNSNKIQYHLKYQDMIDLHVDHFLWIVGSNYIRANDFLTGAEILYRKTDQTNCKVLQVNPVFIILQTRTNCKDVDSLSLLYDSVVFPIKKKNVFLYLNQIYFWEKNQIFLLDIQNNSQKLVYEFSDDIEGVSEQGEFLYIILKNKIQILQKSQKEQEVNRDFNKEYRFSKELLIELIRENDSIKKVQIYNVKSHSKSEHAIDLYENQSKYFFAMDNNLILFVDRNYNLNYWQSSDSFTKKIEKKIIADFKQWKDKIITFNY